MKLFRDGTGKILCASLPVRGAWVEIGPPAAEQALYASLPVRGAWVEIATPGGGVSAR